jgi:putative transposase
MVLHSDRGSQYTSESVKTLIGEQGIPILQSHGVNCYDNAVTESFFHTLKIECIPFDHYNTRDDGHSSLFDYIEVFYNRQRRHSSLGYRTPSEMEESINNT